MKCQLEKIMTLLENINREILIARVDQHIRASIIEKQIMKAYKFFY
jgi:hypothetical protein